MHWSPIVILTLPVFIFPHSLSFLFRMSFLQGSFSQWSPFFQWSSLFPLHSVIPAKAGISSTHRRFRLSYLCSLSAPYDLFFLRRGESFQPIGAPNEIFNFRGNDGLRKNAGQCEESIKKDCFQEGAQAALNKGMGKPPAPDSFFQKIRYDSQAKQGEGMAIRHGHQGGGFHFHTGEAPLFPFFNLYACFSVGGVCCPAFDRS